MRRRALEMSPEVRTSRAVARVASLVGFFRSELAGRRPPPGPPSPPHRTVVKGCLRPPALVEVHNGQGRGLDSGGCVASVRGIPTTGSPVRASHGRAHRRWSDDGGLHLGQPAEQAVDEGRRLVGRQVGREGHRLRDRTASGRSSLQSTSHAPIRRIGAVDGGHPVDRPALAVVGEGGVDVGPRPDDPAPARRCRGCCRRGTQRSASRSSSSLRVESPLVRLEEDVERRSDRAFVRAAKGFPSLSR